MGSSVNAYLPLPRSPGGLGLQRIPAYVGQRMTFGIPGSHFKMVWTFCGTVTLQQTVVSEAVGQFFGQCVFLNYNYGMLNIFIVPV